MIMSSSEKCKRLNKIEGVSIMKNENFKKVRVKEDGRVDLHDMLNLTGSEISVNVLPKGASVPFVHAHKQNEEVYIVIDGKGYAVIDGETVHLEKGDFVRIAPPAKRQFFAANDSDIKYICIQTKENSLQGYTADDAIIY